MAAQGPQCLDTGFHSVSLGAIMTLDLCYLTDWQMLAQMPRQNLKQPDRDPTWISSRYTARLTQQSVI
jgi:hypothetical protein